MRLFKHAEYQQRIKKTQGKMAKNGFDVLLIADPANMNYLIGYDGWSFYVPQVLILSTTHEEPIWIGRAMDANAAKVTTYLPDNNIIGYKDEYVQSKHAHPMSFVADILKEKHLDKKTIAIEKEAYYFSVRAYEVLQTALPHALFKDSRHLVNWIRIIKSDQEISIMKEAAQITENVMKIAIGNININMRQCDLVADIYHAQMQGTSDFGGQYSSFCPMLPTGKGTSTPHLTWTDQPFKKGEATIMELAGTRHRYHCPMARTVFLGKPPQHMADTTKIVLEGLEEAIAFAKPGVTCEEVEAVWQQTINGYKITKDSRLGYSIGLNYPPDWGEHTVSLRPGDKTVLQPNMALHLIPGIWYEDWGIEISESIHITETGCQILANFPRQLFVKD